MGGLRFNPFTGTLDIVDNNELRRSNVVYVDDTYGSDALGLVNRMDRPFKTLNAAWDAAGASSIKNNFTMLVSTGTYTLTASLNDATWTSDARDISIICMGLPSQTVINSAVDAPMIVMANQGVQKKMYIQGGTWNRTSVTATYMFNSQTNDDNELTIKGANINDLAGTDGIFVQRSVELIEDCRIVGTANSYAFLGSGTTSSTLKVNDSYFSLPTASSLFSSTTIRPSTWSNCDVRIPTGIIATGNGNISFTTKDCYIEGSGALIDGRAVSARFINTKLKTLVNSPLIRFDTAANTSAMAVDGLYLEQLETATANCLTRADRGMCPIHIYGRGLWYSERNPPVSGSDPDQVDGGPNGRVGFQMGSATIGNVITINLPGSGAMLAGDPYNTAPIVYNVASTVILDELTAMQVLVRAQVAIGGTPWNAWCQGDPNLVRINAGGNKLLIIMHPQAPGYTKLSTTDNHSSDTLGDINGTANQAADGIVDLVGGPQYALKDRPRTYGGTDYPEKVINPVLNIRQY
jgi:hypothetical protein